MPVRWEPTEEAVMSGLSPGGTFNEDARSTPQDLAGNFNDVRALLDGVPSRRLLVLGRPGAGKSVLVSKLARELLYAPPPGGPPLPVIMRAATWDPERGLSDWIADDLARRFGLDEQHTVNGEMVTCAQALVTCGVVLPILDGLDEMPRSLLPKAVARINQYGSDKPLVVTSRTDDFLDAVSKERVRMFSKAAVVMLRSLLVSDIKCYLRKTTARIPRDRWDKVFGRLAAETAENDEPDGPLADTLANPLMLWLASTVYEHAEREPDELADRTRFGSAATIERHLFSQFVPAVFAERQEQAQRWLAFLAESHPRQDLAWWKFAGVTDHYRLIGWRLARMSIRTALLAGVAWALAAWVLSQHANPGVRHVAPTRLRDVLLGGPLGHLVRPTVDTILDSRPLIRVLSTGEVPPLVKYAVPLALLGLGVVLLLNSSDRDPKELRASSSAIFFSVLRSAVEALALVWTALISIQAATMTRRTSWSWGDLSAGLGTHSNWLLLLVFLLVAILLVPSSFVATIDVSAVSPARALRLDRQADIVVTTFKRAAFAAVLVLYAEPQIALAYAVFAVTATLVATFMGGQRAFASRAYTDACVWLACRRRLPWRTMSFLRDAEHRGVLRQVGAVYQFRHVRLQQELSHWRPQDRREEELAALSEAADTYRRRAAMNPAEFLPDLAKALVRLALECEVMGRREEGLAAFSEAVDTYSKLVETNPAGFQPDFGFVMLTDSLRDYWSFRSHEQEDDIAEPSLHVYYTLASIYRRLAQTDPDAFQPELAESLSDLAFTLECLGRREEELAAISEAVDTYRKLAEKRQITFRPPQLVRMDHLAIRLWKLGRREEALAAGQISRHADRDKREMEIQLRVFHARGLPELADTQKDVRFYRKMARYWHKEAKKDPTGSLPHLADVLSLLAERLDTLAFQLRLAGQDEALAASSEAVDVYCSVANTYRDLAKTDPARFLPSLVESLDTLALQLRLAGQEEEALAASSEAADARRKQGAGGKR